jgi:hypothetical protein
MPKTCQKPLGKNLLKIPQPKIQQKSFMITLTNKNLLKIFNTSKNSLTSIKINKK